MDGHSPGPDRPPRPAHDRGDHRGRGDLDPAPPGPRGRAFDLLTALTPEDSVLTLVGKPDCALCDEMRAVVERALRGSGLRLALLDVREHPDLEKRYVFEIPVLMWQGHELARHRITEADLRDKLRGLSLGPS